MAVKTFKYDDTTKLSEHFKASDFKCKCGTKHDFKVDEALVTRLESLMSKLGSNKFKASSGYRCPTHDKKVGGSGSGSHTEGKALDIKFYDKDGNIIPSSKICVTLENMGHKYGIGYRCGGSLNASGYTHIDVRKRQWYGDESVSFKKSACKTFYKYIKVQYKTTTNMNVRKGAGTKYKVITTIPKDTTFVATEMKRVSNQVWVKNNIGWVCVEGSKVYCNLV